MNLIKKKFESQLGMAISNFLQAQMGETASSVQAFLTGNTLAVRAADCLTPAEHKLAQEESGWQLLLDFKAQQFEQARGVLKTGLEELTGCEIATIVTALSKDGSRFAMVTFLENMEQKLYNRIGENG